MDAEGLEREAHSGTVSVDIKSVPATPATIVCGTVISPFPFL